MVWVVWVHPGMDEQIISPSSGRPGPNQLADLLTQILLSPLCLSSTLPPGIVSIMTLAALAYERYIRVVHAQVVDFPWAWRAIGHIWLYSLAWTGAPLLGWNRYTLEIHHLGCSLDWASKDPNDASFILLFLLGCFFVPVGIMIYCYGNILYAVQMVSHIRRAYSYCTLIT